MFRKLACMLFAMFASRVHTILRQVMAAWHLTENAVYLQEPGREYFCMTVVTHTSRPSCRTF